MVLSGRRWGDEDDDLLPPRTESEPDENGVRTVIEWKLNEAGQKVKITTKVQRVDEIYKISKHVLERKNLKKFGAALKEGDNSNVTYSSNELIYMEDPNADQVLPGDNKDENSVMSGVKGPSIIVCRRCGMVGDHWTLKCPYKDLPPDEIPSLDTKPRADEESNTEDSTATPFLKSSSNTDGVAKYIPPSLRNRVEGSAADTTVDEGDNATLRVTNISPDTCEDDLRELFRVFGPLARVYLAKDRETYQSRGFAFVSFERVEDAERALEKLQGHGYDHLILKLEWARPSNKPRDEDRGTYRSGYGKALPQNLAPPKK